MRISRSYPSFGFAALSVACGALSAAGCGYSMSRPFPATIAEAQFGSAGAEAAETGDNPEATSPRGRIRTVFVEPFRSKEFRRELEMRLTEAVQKRIEMDTPYRIASSRRADTVLSGEILEVRQSSLGTDFVLDRPRELGTTFLMSLRWRHPGTGAMLLERELLAETDTWAPIVGESFFKGSDRVIDRLAERIVEQLESPW